MRRSNMGRLRKFLKLRKRDDRIKLMVLLFLFGVVFVILLINKSLELYRYINSSVEYELTGNIGSDIRVNKLKELENVSAVSLQCTQDHFIKHKTIESNISCVYISSQYVRSVYGIDLKSAMTVFYANEKAFENILGEMELNQYEGDFLESYYSEGIDIEYEGPEGIYIPAKIVYFKNDILDNEPFVFSILSEGQLENKASSIRVNVTKQDTEQIILNEFQKLGFYVQDSAKVVEIENKFDKIFLKVKYEVLICMMCFLWMWSLKKYGMQLDEK